LIVLAEPSPMPPGSLRGLQLVAADAYRAREELVARGVAADEIEVIDERDDAGRSRLQGDSRDGEAVER
jgi:hypothetical protein